MDDRVRLRVLGLSYNQLKSGAFGLLLSEVDGPYTIPVVIGAAEAQSIAMKIEGVKTSRPMTHDLFMSFAQAFGIRLREVFIYKFEDGVFSSELTFDDGDRQVVLDSRTSDAIAIAMRCKAPIWTTHAIIEETGFIIENDSDAEQGGDAIIAAEDEAQAMEPALANYSVEELERLLMKLIQDENYEEAARVSNLLKQKKGL